MTTKVLCGCIIWRVKTTRASAMATAATSLGLVALCLGSAMHYAQARTIRIATENHCAAPDQTNCTASTLPISMSAELNKFKARVWYRIIGSVQFPRTSLLREEKGTTIVSFTVKRSGTISGIKVVRSSGFPDLDRAARQAVMLASPIPTGPDGFPGRDVSFSLPITFRM